MGVVALNERDVDIITEECNEFFFTKESNRLDEVIFFFSFFLPE